MNFVAFEFQDNDFHQYLHKSLAYIKDEQSLCDQRLNDVPDAMLHEAASHLVTAFSYASSVIRWNIGRPADNTYVKAKLKITRVSSLQELRSGFEGYVYNVNLDTIEYFQNW